VTKCHCSCVRALTTNIGDGGSNKPERSTIDHALNDPTPEMRIPATRAANQRRRARHPLHAICLTRTPHCLSCACTSFAQSCPPLSSQVQVLIYSPASRKFSVYLVLAIHHSRRPPWYLDFGACHMRFFLNPPTSRHTGYILSQPFHSPKHASPNLQNRWFGMSTVSGGTSASPVIVTSSTIPLL